MVEPRNLTDRGVDQALIRNALIEARAALDARSESPQLDAELLLAHVLNRPRSYLQAHAEEALQPDPIRRYRALLQRRARGEPVAYLTGEREFWSLSLSITPDVLVPRPETELAVERCLALRPDATGTVADLGTGSGAIALALASERPQWQLIAIDRSEAALTVARSNAARLKIQTVEFLQGEWFEPLRTRRCDLIVSNPPYVAAGDPALDALRFEPVVALSPGITGFEALHVIISQARSHLNPGAALVLEHGTAQGAEVANALVAAGYVRVRCYADLAGHDRVTEARWS
jgi:release factor glutamine methyltransferase